MVGGAVKIVAAQPFPRRRTGPCGRRTGRTPVLPWLSPFTATGDGPPDRGIRYRCDRCDAAEWNSGPAECPAGSEDTAAAWRAGRGHRHTESHDLCWLSHPPRTRCQSEAFEVQSRVDSKRGRHRLLRDATSRDQKDFDLLRDGLGRDRPEEATTPDETSGGRVRPCRGGPSRRTGAAPGPFAAPPAPFAPASLRPPAQFTGPPIRAVVESSRDGGPKKTARPTAPVLDRRISSSTQEIPPDPHIRRAAPQIPVGPRQVGTTGTKYVELLASIDLPQCRTGLRTGPVSNTVGIDRDSTEKRRRTRRFRLRGRRRSRPLSTRRCSAAENRGQRHRCDSGRQHTRLYPHRTLSRNRFHPIANTHSQCSTRTARETSNPCHDIYSQARPVLQSAPTRGIFVIATLAIMRFRGQARTSAFPHISQPGHSGQ